MNNDLDLQIVFDGIFTVECVPLRHGVWKPVFRDGVYQGSKCSECGKFKKKAHINYLRQSYKYCPKCGAKMGMEK